VLKDLILIAEDNSDVAEGLVDMLMRSGLAAPFHVIVDGEELLKYLQGHGRYVDRKLYPLPKVLLLDLAMKKKGGLEVFFWLRMQPGLNFHVIVLVDCRNADQMTIAYELGAQSFLTKPLLEDEVRSLVRRLNEAYDG
jgi:CheY-like chemotaxis protein